MTHLTILGGGPAGLGVAYYAHRAGVPFDLFERERETGGMCRTLRSGAHLYDRGAHRFHDKDPEITADVQALLGDDLVRVEAPSAIWDLGRWLDFPPTPLNALFAYGPREAGRIVADLVRAGLRRRRPDASFEDFAVRRFGATLARRILLNYSAKLWGLPTSQLSPDVATRRLRGMTLRTLFYELVFPDAKTEHVDGSFYYPREGYGQIVDALARSLPEESLHAGHRVAALESADGRVRRVRFADGRTRDVPDRLVSTLPLPALVALLGEAAPEAAREAAARLRFRHVRLLFLRLSIDRVTNKASVYVPDPAYIVSRLYEPRNRSPRMAPPGETSLVVEAPCFRGDAVECLPPDVFASRVVDELAALRLLDPKWVLESRQDFIPNAYPVYTTGYARDVGAITDGLAGISNLATVGRAGRFHYSHLHDQLRFAKDYVEALETTGEARSA